jgi:hypothetical protein
MSEAFTINCVNCKAPVPFALKLLDKFPCISKCPGCKKPFGIEPGSLARQIKLFVALCQQLDASEEILSDASVAVRVGNEEVKVPFKLLLTRLRSTLDIEVDGQKVSISYRTEPLQVAKSLTTQKE